MTLLRQLAAAALVLCPALPADATPAQKLHCEIYQDRANTICKAVESELNRSHATITASQIQAPETIRNVFCEAHVTPSDVPALKQIEFDKDIRLFAPARQLHQLVQTPRELLTDKNGRYNPESPNYILKEGCKE